MSAKTFTINLEWKRLGTGLFWTLLFVGLTYIVCQGLTMLSLSNAGGKDFYDSRLSEYGYFLYHLGITSISAVAVFICLCLVQIVRYLAKIAKTLEISSGIP